MPNSDSCDACLSATLRSAARVLDSCGVSSVLYTSHMTDVAAAADRVGEGGDRLEYAVRGVALCLVRAGTVEAPDRRFGAVGEDLGLRPQLGGRSGAVDPDVLSFVSHGCPLRWGMCER